MGLNKFLTFSLDGEIYGLPILRVQEIIGMMTVTKFPNSSDYIRGMINLRGKVIPVIDLRVRFGISKAEITEKTCIIVLSMNNKTGEVRHGIMLDADKIFTENSI
ncbi:MAG: chemotaxis protein CheW [Candidatus Muirbacterium halophilum]|nr:chemotaxis protein CheW [Candidatus Muirbacterium halophilum]MCK9477398.1 chemotaxis protein CheW [Candidatus Muirbacterium halophilum]